tara:strand:+ start:1640 stop:3517 length:1878 start_codon:yes stop_codon:yes gene_type:complete
MSSIRKILNTGTNKYQNAVREMKRSIYSDNVYVSLHANSISSNIDNTLESLNEFWMSSVFMQRVIRDNYRLCFPRVNWTKSEQYDRYNPEENPQTQNCVIFDDKIGDGVLFLCVGNNIHNRTDYANSSVYRPSFGYTSVADLPSGVIEHADGYRWIPLAQTDTRFTDSTWVSLEVRDGVSFFGSDEGNYIDDGVTLLDFKTAVAGGSASGISFGQTGAVNFYAVNNEYDQTASSEVASGAVLFSTQNMERYDAFIFQQALKLKGNDTQIRFDSGNSSGALPSTITPIPLYDQIVNSPFSVTSPVGWYNKRVREWENKAGSVEMVYLDPKAGNLSGTDFRFTGLTAPSIEAKGNGTSPTVDFITTKINDNTWEIRGVEVTTNLSTNERNVGINNTRIEFQVENTDNNLGFENSIKYLLTPYGGLLKEENLYGPVIPVNAFMMNVTIDETDISTTLETTASGIISPTQFDAYSLIVDANNYANDRELGLDLPANKTEFLDQTLVADFSFSGVTPPKPGDLIYEGNPKIGTGVARGALLGIVQTIENPAPVSSPYNIQFTTSQPDAFGSGKSFYIGSGTSFKAFSQITATKNPDAKALTGSVVHMGKASFDLSSATTKRITIKYITRV